MSERVLIIGDGPTGLSAALILAKTGFDVTVVGGDSSATRKAQLHNYLALDGTSGPDFLAIAREHVERYGAKLVKANVERVEQGPPLRALTDAGTFEAEQLVLATGFGGPIEGLPLDRSESGVRVDLDGRTSVEGVYAGGALVRGMKSQVATSVGDGAAIAVDILSRARGKPSHDYDALKSPSAPPRPRS